MIHSDVFWNRTEIISIFRRFWVKGGGKVCPHSGPNRKVLRTSTIRCDLIDLDELIIFCHRTWSPEHCLKEICLPQFMKLLRTLSPYYTDSIWTVEWVRQGCLCRIDSSWDVLQTHAKTWSIICWTGIPALVNTVQDVNGTTPFPKVWFRETLPRNSEPPPFLSQ